MSIKVWVKKRNWSRLAELRHFTLQNIMFFLAILAFSVVLFNLAGGWEVIGMNDFHSTWLAWLFFGLTLAVLFLLFVSALVWLCSKRTDIKRSYPDDKSLKPEDGVPLDSVSLDICSKDFADMSTKQIKAFFEGLVKIRFSTRESRSVVKDNANRGKKPKKLVNKQSTDTKPK